MKAPDFSLPDQNSITHTLKEYKGKWIIVYFYPKDDTPGCTKEACGFRDSFTAYAKAGIPVIGISKDSVASHKKFAEKYKLPFTLLSDESKETITAFGAWGEKKFMGKTFEGILRKTYIIDPEGTIRKTYDKVTPATHAAEILSDLQQLR
jgi:thioredoxin-dependent peroxiredoxin